MGDYLQTKNEVRHCLMARTPLVVLKTAERERAEKMLRELAEELTTRIYYHTDSRGLRILGAAAPAEMADSDALLMAAEFFKKHSHGILALGDVKRASEDNPMSRELLSILYLALESGGSLILITPDPVWQRLAQFGLITHLDYPVESERRAQLKAFIERYKNAYLVEWGDQELQRAAALLGGFTQLQIENILRNALAKYGGLHNDKLDDLTSQKERMYACPVGVSVIEVRRDLEVSGLETLKAWLKKQRAVFFADDEILTYRDLKPPKGVLLAGVPGCGKSLSAKLIAREWGLPLLRFDIGAIYDKWLGSSEQRMSEALRYIENMAPCVLWMDEIEKGLASSENESSRRVLGQFLFWLQENEKRVFVAATANDIAALPPELFRKGRFSETFFIGLPNKYERAQAIERFCLRSLHRALPEETLERFANLTHGFSYADIEYAVKETAQSILTGSEDSDTTLEQAINRIVPISRSSSETIEKLEAWGKMSARSASGEA